MRIHVLSDLHLGVAGMDMPEVDADVTVLAGDIARPPEAAMAWAARINRPVLFVPGNHEFYGGTVSAVRQELRAAAQRHGIHVLDETGCEHGGVRFLGATLWTDFDLYGVARREEAMAAAGACMRDFQRIRLDDGTRFTPEASRQLFAHQYAWLAARLAQPFTGPTVVITHHAPSPTSLDPRYRDVATSAAFVSDCRALFGAPALWIHGHLHASFDYVEQGTRVVCNPRGYCPGGVPENPHFDPAFVVDVPVVMSSHRS